MPTAFSPSWYSQPSMSTIRASNAGEPVQHRGATCGSRCRPTTIAPSATRRPRIVSGDRRGALAAGLDLPVGRLAEDRQVGGQPFRVLAPGSGSARCVRTRSPRSRRTRRSGRGTARQGRGQVQQHRVTGLHVGGAAAVQGVAVQPGRHVVGDRHGVDVPGQQHPGRPAEVRPGQHRVARPAPPEARSAPAAPPRSASAIGPSVPDTDAMSTSAAVSSAGSDRRSSDDRGRAQSLRGWRTRQRTVPSLTCASR